MVQVLLLECDLDYFENTLCTSTRGARYGKGVDSVQ